MHFARLGIGTQICECKCTEADMMAYKQKYLANHPKITCGHRHCYAELLRSKQQKEDKDEQNMEEHVNNNRTNCRQAFILHSRLTSIRLIDLGADVVVVELRDCSYVKVGGARCSSVVITLLCDHLDCGGSSPVGEDLR
ncbi:hypothetical protein TRVL_10317 [Trypanosoma vivax]|nr:hypothetical protein TRVL_10317 [Trypanosoma vivax]